MTPVEAMNSEAAAYASLLAGGKFEFLSDDGVVLAQWDKPSFLAPVAGTLVAERPKIRGLRAGEIVAFRAVTATGEVVQQGPAGERAGSLFPVRTRTTAGETL